MTTTETLNLPVWQGLVPADVEQAETVETEKVEKATNRRLGRPTKPPRRGKAQGGGRRRGRSITVRLIQWQIHRAVHRRTHV